MWRIELSLHRPSHRLPAFKELLPIVPPLQLAAFLPATGRFVADEVELEERPKGPLQDPRISILEPKKVGCFLSFFVAQEGGLHGGRQWCGLGGCRLAWVGSLLSDWCNLARACVRSAPPTFDQLRPPLAPPLLLQFFGVSGFGFTKENELFVGRMAQLGFAAGG